MSICLMDAPPAVSYRRYEPSDYPDDMAVTKVSISLDSDVLDAAREAARDEGRSLSSWLNALADRHLRLARGRAAVREFEADHGPIPEEDRIAAEKFLREAGIGR
ncbi:MAG: hypothetical protein ACQSGP_22285 [Frankia sp.]